MPSSLVTGSTSGRRGRDRCRWSPPLMLLLLCAGGGVSAAALSLRLQRLALGSDYEFEAAPPSAVELWSSGDGEDVFGGGGNYTWPAGNLTRDHLPSAGNTSDTSTGADPDLLHNVTSTTATSTIISQVPTPEGRLADHLPQRHADTSTLYPSSRLRVSAAAAADEESAAAAAHTRHIKGFALPVSIGAAAGLVLVCAVYVATRVMCRQGGARECWGAISASCPPCSDNSLPPRRALTTSRSCSSTRSRTVAGEVPHAGDDKHLLRVPRQYDDEEDTDEEEDEEESSSEDDLYG